ncbi:hypothetical protein BBP40_001914 [Aspergillus hancockii]|nr:hypothetical protein BBP40_001914 [Aspergillus hancockii]
MVTAEERSSAVDFVNYLNLLYEEFDHNTMSSNFTPDAAVNHAYGTFRGSSELRTSIERDYPPLDPGVSRHAANHTVSREVETGGVIVRYHNELVCYAWPSDAHKVTGKGSV